jgi:hypothetical protein
VVRRCDEADLTGHYAFSSLRNGFIRSALREGVPKHVIAQHVGFRSLAGVESREGSERLLHGNIAELIGL